MRYATAYDVGERKRPRGINEDSVAVSVFEDGHREGYLGPSSERDGEAAGPGDHQPGTTRSAAVLVLADGAGGHDAGDAASYIATTRVAEELAPVAVRAASADPGAFDVDVPGGEEPDFAGAIEGAIQAAHEDVLEYAEESGTAAYTTVVAGVVADGRFHYGWVGDSRAYVCNAAHDHIARLTEDHAVVERLHAEGEVDGVEAQVHPRGNELTRAVGGRGDEAIDVETAAVDVFAEDTLLLTSDGLPDAQSEAASLYDDYVGSGRSDDAAETVRKRVVTDDDIRDWVLETESLSAAADRLVAAGNEHGGKDNLSVLLCREPAFPATPPRLPVRGRDPHPAHRRETLVEE